MRHRLLRELPILVWPLHIAEHHIQRLTKTGLLMIAGKAPIGQRIKQMATEMVRQPSGSSISARDLCNDIRVGGRPRGGSSYGCIIISAGGTVITIFAPAVGRGD